MNLVSIFNFNNNAVRIAYDENGNPLFCLTDLCKVLNISRSSDLLQVQRGYGKNEPLKRHGALDPLGIHEIVILTNGGNQTVKFISEPNLYRVIFRSTKSEALNFQNWIFSEVIPSIRKTGSYSVHARQTAYNELNRIFMDEKVSKDKATFHSHGMHKRKREKKLNALRINTCKTNIQLTFEGVV